MKKVFQTCFGSEYYKGEDGFWTRNKYTGETFENYIYLGSIDSAQNPAFVDKGKSYIEDLINSQFSSGSIPGFVPDFIIGNSPIGVIGIQPGDIIFKNKRLAPSPTVDLDTKVRIHVGDVITQVF